MKDSDIILEVNGLRKYFPITTTFWRRTIGHVKAVDDVRFSVLRGETLGLVGESGCGKTTLGRCVLRAIEPSAGEVVYRLDADRQIDIMSLDQDELRPLRRNMQMVFQDPYSSLDPRMTVLDIIGEPLHINQIGRKAERTDRVKELMSLVGLDARYLRRYPHAFSGGQRQRIGVARALATNPSFIVCDEPVSALDVSVRAQIINLLIGLQDRLGLSYLFISHDLSVVRHISHRIAVMYVGKMVELASSDDLFTNPQHPYTEALLSAVPQANPRLKREQILLGGEIANPAKPPSGCYLHPRCRYAKEICAEVAPEWREHSPGHYASCHRADELSLQGAR